MIPPFSLNASLAVTQMTYIWITAFTGRRITVCKSEPFAEKVILTFYEQEEEW